MADDNFCMHYTLLNSSSLTVGQINVSELNVFTNDTFIDIKGQTGPDGFSFNGKNGSTGPVGLTGTAGRDGSTGPTGLTGTAGRDGFTGQTGPTGPYGNTTIGFIAVFGGNMNIQSNNNLTPLIYNSNKNGLITDTSLINYKNKLYLPLDCSLTHISYTIENIPSPSTFLCIFGSSQIVWKQQNLSNSGSINIDPSLFLLGSPYQFKNGMDCCVGFQGDAVGKAMVTLYFI